MTNQLQKAVTASYLDTQGVGGDSLRGSPMLRAQQADAFLDSLWDATALGQSARRIRLDADTAEIDRISVGRRLLRVATEAVDDHVNATASFSKIALRTTKLRFDWELSTEAREDSRLGDTIEDRIAGLFAVQLGNDMEDLVINGDSTQADPLMAAFDGYRKLATDSGTVIEDTDAQANGISRSTFAKAVKALPRRYMQRRSELKFYTGTNVLTDYGETLMGYEFAQQGIIEGSAPYANQPNGPATDASRYQVMGIGVAEIPMMPETLNADGTALAGNGDPQYGSIELTFPQNRIWAVKREFEVYQEFKPKKDTTEWTMFTRVGVQIEDPEAYVIVNGVKIAE